ncbi:la domain family [Trichoderma arundinaceum]|uniref:La domain family n=1 Tax=Trichoderma arundinaceum TaxID=490622 RepID=A0A395N907_TRIAR|nr:la domain family [Trichoderma arundinaceum]
MATASAFSYAQAAKGQGTVPSNTLPGQPVQDSQPSAAAPKAAVDVESAIESTDAVRSADSSANAEKQDIVSTTGSEVEARSEDVQETRREPLRDDDSGRLDRPWRRGDKGTRSSSTTTRSVDEQDSRRPRKSKKSKASEKQANDQSAVDKDQESEKEVPKVELFEAPIPSVNIWRQRAEAHLAKAKPSTANSAEQTSNGLSKSDAAPKAAENGVPAASQRDNIPNGVKSHRKSVDAPRSERNASRGSRLADKDANGVPPSVADTAAWPTPETSIKEEKKKPTDKTDRSEKDAPEDASQSKPRQKEKWVTMDYVPSVNFETQLPQMRNSKPRGGARNANGSRATGASHASDKAAAPAASQGKFNENSNKDRPRDGANGPNRNTPLPQTSKRTSTDMSSAREQKKGANQTGSDKNKDSTSNSNEQGHAVRERTENRSDRPRGGYRGRGGHHPVNTQHQHQHTASSFSASGAIGGRGQGPYSPPPRQGGHGQMYMPSQRGGRGGRNNAGNFHRMSLPNGSARIPQVQTQFGPYEYPMTPMTTVPFQPQPYWDNMFMVLKSQVEYYFSIENLCKDVYLRARMDSQGFVPLHFIASFKRVRELSADIAMVRAVCETSTEVDLVVGEDDVERVRRSQAWESFVLPLGDRDEFARNHGPAHLTFKNRPSQLPPQFNGMPVPYGLSSPPAYAAHPEAPFQQIPDESIANQGVNGLVNGQVNGHPGASQLSADVPDFAPSGALQLGDQVKINGSAVVNGHAEKPVEDALPNGVHDEQSA